MENVISILKARPTELEFNVDIGGSGTQTSQKVVKFVIDTPDVSYSFMCKSVSSGVWIVTIPPLPSLVAESYSFHIEVIVDGYFFEPLRGVANIIIEPTVGGVGLTTHKPAAPVVTVATSTIRAPIIPEPKEEEEESEDTEVESEVKQPEESEKEEDKKEEVAESIDPSDNLLTLMMGRRKKRSKKIIGEKDEAVRKALDAVKKSKQSEKESVFEQDPEVVIEQALHQVGLSTHEETIPEPSQSNQLSEKDMKVKQILGIK